MRIDLNKIESVTFPGMNNGTGMLSARMYNDSYRIIPALIHPSGSNGIHKQESWIHAHLSERIGALYHQYRRGRSCHSDDRGEEMSTYLFEKPMIQGTLLKRKAGSPLWQILTEKIYPVCEHTCITNVFGFTERIRIWKKQKQ